MFVRLQSLFIQLATRHSPSENHHKVHDVPAISQVGVLVEGKTEGQDLYSGLKTEDTYEVRLCVILGEATEVRRGLDG